MVLLNHYEQLKQDKSTWQFKNSASSTWELRQSSAKNKKRREELIFTLIYCTVHTGAACSIGSEIFFCHFWSKNKKKNTIRQQNESLNYLTACRCFSIFNMYFYEDKCGTGQTLFSWSEANISQAELSHNRNMQHIHSHQHKEKCERLKVCGMKLSGISPNTLTAEQQGPRSVCRPERKLLGFIAAVLENTRPWETEIAQ